jgi:hypothetical protein
MPNGGYLYFLAKTGPTANGPTTASQQRAPSFHSFISVTIAVKL